MKWGSRKFNYFATMEEVRELTRDLLMLIKDEERYFNQEETTDEP